MGQSRESTEFYTIREAAQISKLAAKTWYQGGAGTNAVLRIRFGRAVRLLRVDVEQFIIDRIAEAKQNDLQRKE